MGLPQRQEIFKEIEKIRGGRTLICYLNFDRASGRPAVQGVASNFSQDVKEPLYRVLKESVSDSPQIDLLLYTRGGEVDSVWPLVSIIREFDPKFNVLVPYRCHSAGTLVCLAAEKLIMAPLAELSPIDPTTGNQFNPPDPANPQGRLGISVEDVTAYRDFALQQFGLPHEPDSKSPPEVLLPFLERLINEVHPIALGNIHRVNRQIRRLGKKLLELNQIKGMAVDEVISSFATEFFSHLHMINRSEALDILGGEKLVFADAALSKLLDSLLRAYEDTFDLRTPFFVPEKMADNLEREFKLAGGVVESKSWGYLFQTNLTIRQRSQLPPNVQLQVPAGQPVPLVAGAPREYNIDVTFQKWRNNNEPRGIDV